MHCRHLIAWIGLVLAASATARAVEPHVPQPSLADPYLVPAGESTLPFVAAGADAVFLARDGARSAGFASRGATPTQIVLDSDAIEEFEYDGGARVMLGLGIAPDVQLVASYTGLHTWDQEASVRNTDPNNLGGAGNLFSPFTLFGKPPQEGVDYNTFVSIRSATDLDNADVNLYCRWPVQAGEIEFASSFGIRYVRLTEDFTYRSEAFVPPPGGATTVEHVAVDNDLWGLQMGGLSTYTVVPDWWLDCEIKCAVCENAAEQLISFGQRDERGNSTFVARGDREGGTALVGELSLTSNARLGPLVLRFGYQILWLDGVAIGSENFSSDLAQLTLGPARVVDDGTLVFHGPHLGALVTW